MAELNPDNYKEIFPQPVLDSAHTRKRFESKVAIVTGGASGIGRATVERFSNDGAAVAIFDIDQTFGNALEKELTSQGQKVKFYKVDVSNKEECLAAVKKVADDNGGMVNFLVNSVAHVGTHKSSLDLSVNDWTKDLSVNIVGYSNMVQACCPYMEKGSSCAIVHISSCVAKVAMPYMPWTYPASKGAINILTKCMALDLSEAGIRVNSVSPGPVWTPVWQRVPAEYVAEKRKYNMLKRMAEASEIASVVTFLCSKDASFIDGANVPVDAGVTAMGPEGSGVPSF